MSAITRTKQQFDVASKRITNSSPALLGRLFGINVPSKGLPGPTELNLAETHADRRNADLVLTGDKHVVHLEFQRRADPTMADRMLIYRSLLRVEPACVGKRIQQHVIVLGEGSSPSRIDEPDLTFVFDTHYARDVDPVTAFADPLTAPWAMLAAAGDSDERITRLVNGMRVVASVESESLRLDLIRTMLEFAAITMRREDIERALREAGMPADMIRDTEFAQELIDEGRVEGRRRGTLEHIVRVLSHRGVGDREAHLIAEALLEQDLDTSVERAAFGDLNELAGLAA